MRWHYSIQKGEVTLFLALRTICGLQLPSVAFVASESVAQNYSNNELYIGLNALCLLL